MTTPLLAAEVAAKIEERFPDAVVEAGDTLVVEPARLADVARFLRESPEFSCDYLAHVTGVDYMDYFEVVYYLNSIEHNHGIILKTRVWERDDPVVPSVVSIWPGADFQEREVYDLVGVRFAGHPNMKRVLLWEGFPGHPLRKDYLWDQV